MSTNYSPSSLLALLPQLTLLLVLSSVFLIKAILLFSSIHISSVVQSCLTLWTPWAAARQATLSITNSQNFPKLKSIESAMPSNHVILCHPLHLLPSIFPSIRVFSNESALHIRWPKYWSFSYNINPSKQHSGLISFRMD